MNPQRHTKAFQGEHGASVLDNQGNLSRKLFTLSGKEALDWILKQEKPRKTVEALSCGDFFWLAKKIGEDDFLPLLELASLAQWQYLVDLDIWKKDQLDMASATLWLQRFQQADSDRIAKWLLGEGQAFAHYYFLRTVEVIESSDDDIDDLSDEFFRLDEYVSLKVIDPEHRKTLEDIIYAMAKRDLNRCRDLLLRSQYALSAAMEEEMYRLKCLRLAERGFLPFEEALSVYAPLDPDVLNREELLEQSHALHDEEMHPVVSVTPLFLADPKDILMRTVSRITDPLLLERIRLEFAGLCNQILSADALPVNNLEVLSDAVKKAAGYINMAFEKLCGDNAYSAEKLITNNHLESLFRAGFGLALKLKREAERWRKESWFHRHGLGEGFWGEQWGSVLSGLLKKKPRLYADVPEGEAYKDFERISELDECRKVLRRLMALDRLLKRLSALYPADEALIRSGELTFYSLLFNLWSRLLLKLESGFYGISLEQAKAFFRHLRAGDKKPPFCMPGFEEIFLADFMAHASGFDPESESILKDTLSIVWQEFHSEYERILVSDLDSRFSKFISVIPAQAPILP